MSERDYSVETLINAEDRGLLEPWGFEQSGYVVVEDGYEPTIVQKVESALNSCDAQPVNTICALMTALEGGEKTTAQLAYEIGYGTRPTLLEPYIQMAQEARLIERTGSADASTAYWKASNE